MAKGLVASVLVAALCGSALAAGPPNMSVAEYVAAKRQLSTALQAANAVCRADAKSGGELCLTDAMGRDWIAKADLEVAYRSTPRSRFEANVARAEAHFWLARERCDEITQPDRPGCLQDANAVRLAARAEGATQRKSEELDDACVNEVAAGGQSHSRACVLRATEARKPQRRGAP
jgi:hypothetical protein